MVSIVVRRVEEGWRVEADGADRGAYRSRAEALGHVVEQLEAARDTRKPNTVRFER